MGGGQKRFEEEEEKRRRWKSAAIRAIGTPDPVVGTPDPVASLACAGREKPQGDVCLQGSKYVLEHARLYVSSFVYVFSFIYT